MKTRISRAYRGSEHVGWKKTIGGHEWFLGYGTRPADEAKAIAIAEVLEAKWRLIKACGGTELSQTDFEDAKAMISGQPRWGADRPEAISAMTLADAAPVAAKPVFAALPAAAPAPSSAV